VGSGVGVPVDAVTFGEALAALRAVEPVAVARSLGLSVAGAETNVAIGLARLGHRCAWVGTVGSDRFGAMIIRTLRAETVNVEAVRVVDAPTGIILFEQREPAAVTVDYHRHGSAGTQLGSVDAGAAAALEPRVLHTSGVTLALSPAAAAAAAQAMTLARRSGTVVSFDVNFRSRLWSAARAAEVLRSVAGSVDVLFASPDELALVAPEAAADEPSRVRALLEQGVGRVLVKRGAGGATEYTAHGRADRAALPVHEVDPVGAGDAFAAGYLSALLDGEPLAALERATRLGAFAVCARGDWEGLPSRDELAAGVPGAGRVQR
jgi:2-dehydro-3-deoxygluconokinase